MKRTITILLIVVLCSVVAGCSDGEDTPKPKAYLRITLPEKRYRVCDTTGLPFTFECAQEAAVVWKKNTGRDKWIDIAYPSHNSIIFLSYRSIHSLQELKAETDTSYQFLTVHFKQSSGVDEKQYVNTAEEVYATTFHLKGKNVASTYQFWATDSSSHFLRGALYINCPPNNDSLAPLIEYLQSDVNRLIETLRWR